MAASIVLTVVIFVLLSLYFLIFRPKHLRWGATNEEVKAKMPGDEIVKTAHFNATRAISINATPENIWKWIIQIGSKRAGWYSIDWIDNGGTPSSTKIVPEFQVIHKGQFIPFTPDQKNGMWVNDYSSFKYILWADKAGKASWLWYLIPVGDNATRLITRLRTKYAWTSLWIIYYLIYDIGDIIMMRKCMKGKKQRQKKSIE